LELAAGGYCICSICQQFQGSFWQTLCTSTLLYWYWLRFHMRRWIYRSTGLHWLKEDDDNILKRQLRVTFITDCYRTRLYFYPNVTTLRSGVCYRKSVCL